MVTKKSKGLGRGLEALLGPKIQDEPVALAALHPGTGAASRWPHTLKLSQLQAGKYQPRTRMDEGSLYELAESIKAQGIMQPILVRPLRSERIGNPQYEIIAGERRSKAAQLAGLDEVPVLVKEVPDEAAAAMALIENIQRENLNPLEEAQGIKRLTDEFGLTHDQAAQAVGRSRSATSNLLRLLNLSGAVQTMLMAGDLDMGHARALLALHGAAQIQAASEIAAKKLNVREAERLVAKHQQPLKKGPMASVGMAAAIASKSKDIQRIEQTLSDVLTASVEIRVKKRTARGEQGEVAIAFSSLDELNGLLDKLGLPAY